MSYRTLQWAAPIAAGALCGSTALPASTPVTLGVVTWIAYGPIYCAAANGYALQGHTGG